MSKLIAFNGYAFNFANIDNDMLMIATINAANGINDLLVELFNNEIS